MPTPQELLEAALEKAVELGETPAVSDDEARNRIRFIARCLNNRAGVRLLMACMLAKAHQPKVDPRKPYTEIGDEDTFSGRTYDEAHLTKFISENKLPCNSTTAFLTPALRNRNATLTTSTNLSGRPPVLYEYVLHLLDDVATGKSKADDILVEVIRQLIEIREEREARLASLRETLRHGNGALPLSSEQIVTLLEQHLACKNSSRLPVLIVTAAYNCAQELLKEAASPLQSHLSADQQSGALGDVEVCLINESEVRTVYEMKQRRVKIEDVDRALEKITDIDRRPDNYIFITTAPIEEAVREYASEQYESTGGVEFAVLDCIGFSRHFLHLFHRIRMEFLEAYQALVLLEPDSAVNQPLKEALLTLRQAAESDE